MPAKTTDTHVQDSSLKNTAATAKKPRTKRKSKAESILEVATDHLAPELDTLINKMHEEQRTLEVFHAMGMYHHGFNVLPLPYASKAGWPWKPLQFSRLHPLFLPILFDRPCNFAIMTGRTSQNLFVIDCETREAFEEQDYLFRVNNIPRYSVLTNGPQDGGHFYLRAAGGEVQNIRSGFVHGLEVRGSRCYVVAPPSVHPITHREYQWDVRDTYDPPVVDIRQLYWLPLRLTSKQKITPQPVSPLYDINPELIKLSRRTLNFIYSGAPEGRRNNELFAALCDMIGNGFDDYTIEDMLTEAAESSGLFDDEIRSTIRSAHSKRRVPARPEKPTVTREPAQWEIALRWAQNYHWEGRTGLTDRAVFIAMCERAKMHSSEAHKPSFRASVREVAELAQVRRETASKSIQRLLTMGFIERAGRDTHSLAALYCFGRYFEGFEGKTLHERATIIPWSMVQWPAYANFPPQLNADCNAILGTFDPLCNAKRNDAFERNALGKTATLVWQNLLGIRKPLKPKMIAEVCQLKIHQVYHALKKLSQYSLVVKGKKGWSAVSANDEWLNENVATPAGTLGRMDARRAKHELERSLRAGWEVVMSRERHERAYYAHRGVNFLRSVKADAAEEKMIVW